jgi:hypothetical protein
MITVQKHAKIFKTVSIIYYSIYYTDHGLGEYIVEVWVFPSEHNFLFYGALLLRL